LKYQDKKLRRFILKLFKFLTHLKARGKHKFFVKMNQASLLHNFTSSNIALQI
jgi:hypothetical protein